MRSVQAEDVQGEGLLSLLRRIFAGGVSRDATFDRSFRRTSPQPSDWPVAPPAALDTATAAELGLTILDLLAERGNGGDAVTLAAQINAARRLAVSAVDVQHVLERLYDQHELAGYGPVFCLPEQVSVLRKSWLLRASLGMPGEARDVAQAMREAAAVQRICQWDGWNMPIARGMPA